MNFKRIQTELNISLPSFYRIAINNYPFTAVDELDFVEDNLIKDVTWIIEHNAALRTSSFFGKEWPQNYFVIGHDGFGNYFFLNLKDNDQAIYFADHDEDVDLNNLSYLMYSSSMSVYISMNLEDQKEIVGG